MIKSQLEYVKRWSQSQVNTNRGENHMKKYRVAIVGLGRIGSTLDMSVANACKNSERLDVKTIRLLLTQVP